MSTKNRSSSAVKESANATLLASGETLRYSKIATLLIMFFELLMVAYWFISYTVPTVPVQNIHYLYGYVSLCILSGLTFLLLFLLGKEPDVYAKAILTTQSIFALSFTLWSIYFTCFDAIYRDSFSALTYATVITIIPIITFIPPRRWIALHILTDLIMLYIAFISNVDFFNFATSFIVYAVVSIIIGCFYYYTRMRGYRRQMELQELSEEHRRIAYTDELTGAPNRRAYTEHVDALREGQMPDNFTVVVVDINGLKKTNDSFGHLAGDEIIVATSECISDAFGVNTPVYRIGGDEFLLFADIDEAHLQSSIAMLREELSKWHGFHCPSVSAAIGYACRRDHRISTLKELTILADEDMYKDKSAYYNAQSATSPT